jgi:NAD(P)H-dependent FMN reductase
MMNHKSTSLLAISGSLRIGSKNTVLLEAMARLASGSGSAPASASSSTGADVDISIYEGLGQLPLFNPDLDDLDGGTAPPPVLELRRRLTSSRGLVICSPEYAHGVAGAMKNALDWLVGSGELMSKPVLVLNASPTSFHAHLALLETLRTMDAIVLEQTLPPPPLGGSTVTVESLLEAPERAAFFSSALDELLAAIAAAAA